MTASSFSANPAAVSAVRNYLTQAFAEGIAAATDVVEELLQAEAAAASAESAAPDAIEQLKTAAMEARGIAPRLTRWIGENLPKRFDARLQTGAASARTLKLSLDSLTLVDDQQIQEEIALGHLTKRLKEQSDYELYALSRRLGVLLGQEELAMESSPVFPSLFARTLLDGLAQCGVDPAVRLALLKGYGPSLLELVPSIYAGANAFLLEQGIQIEIREYYGRPVLRQGTASGPSVAAAPESAVALASPRGNAPQAQTAVAATAEEEAKVLHALARLLPASAAAAGGAAGRPGDGAMLKVEIPASLVDTLQKLDAQLRNAERGTWANVVHDARNALDGNGPDRNLHDLVTADIVAAMFDRLFAEPRVPGAVKAQIGRLQIPILKLAMKDRSLFSRRDHAARQLIDVLVEFGTLHEALYAQGAISDELLSGIVERIAHDSAADESHFRRALEQVQGILDRQDEITLASDAAIQEITEAERREDAFAAARSEIIRRAGDRPLPLTVAAFLHTTWMQVLAQDYLYGGQRGEAWRIDTGTLDKLLESLRPAEDPEARRAVARGLTSVIELLKDGAARVGADPTLTDTFFDDLREAHLGAQMPLTVLGTDEPKRDDPESTEVLPSSVLFKRGLSRGTWLELTLADGRLHRYRISFISSGRGTTVMKDPLQGHSFAMSVNELLAKLDSGEARVVEGIGVASASVDAAIRAVASSRAA